MRQDTPLVSFRAVRASRPTTRAALPTQNVLTHSSNMIVLCCFLFCRCDIANPLIPRAWCQSVPKMYELRRGTERLPHFRVNPMYYA